jgi:hypothetical protein
MQGHIVHGGMIFVKKNGNIKSRPQLNQDLNSNEMSRKEGTYLNTLTVPTIFGCRMQK